MRGEAPADHTAKAKAKARSECIRTCVAACKDDSACEMECPTTKCSK
ncbi:MAG TPA: hypothetical protein VF316_00845 [Polyangiaceae bacterium]